MQWLDIRLQLIGVAVVTGLGVIAVIQHQFNSVDPGETTTEFSGCKPEYKTFNSCCGSSFVRVCVFIAGRVRSGRSVPVLRSVHHNAAVGPHIQFHSDWDAAGECGANWRILHLPANRATAPEHAGQTSCHEQTLTLTQYNHLWKKCLKKIHNKQR